MAVADPASPSIRVGANALWAQASDAPASAASAAITRTMGMPVTRVASAAPKTPSPLPADADGVHAFGERRVRRLVGPHKVIPLVLVGDVCAVHEQFAVPADLVCDRGVEVLLRCLVLFQAGDAAHVLHHCSLRTVVVRDAGLESLALVPEDEIPRLS